MKNEKVVVIGLGYVGLPVAVAAANVFDGVIGFDISEPRVAELRAGHDRTGEIAADQLARTSLAFTTNADDLAAGTFFIVTVPTPIDAANRPDLMPVRRACELIGPRLQPGALVVFESTVYPGVTEDICGPLLEQCSGLRRGVDFTLGYSPERINPGDKAHRIDTITKVISAEDAASVARVEAVYGAFVTAGLHRAPSIKVAEAAKVIENTQRDLNIALMNELSVIFDRMDIRTRDVLAAAGTKWNFLPFQPGLVGGHCIGVDPYYLTSAAEQLGYNPQVILSGRRINDHMAEFVATKLVKLLSAKGCALPGARVGVLGLTFKENVPDLRNSKVPDIIAELRDYGITPLVHDPIVTADEAHHEYGLKLVGEEAIADLDALIVAVAHDAFRDMGPALLRRVRGPGVILDLKGIIDESAIPAGMDYWSL